MSTQKLIQLAAYVELVIQITDCLEITLILPEELCHFNPIHNTGGYIYCRKYTVG